MNTFQHFSITVSTARLAEFYEWFGGRLGLLGQSFRHARLILSTLIETQIHRYWADHFRETHAIANGRYGIAGSMAWPWTWPGRILRRRSRPLPLESEPDEPDERGGSVYWMRPSVAGLFAGARADDER